MVYINPVEILNFYGLSQSENGNTAIKKAKRRLFADIDLSDEGHYDYKGVRLSKSDCEKAIEDLENPQYIEFYQSLVENELLNNYLVNGDELFFNNFRTESIYNFTDFIDFISPYFAKRLDKSLIRAFHTGDEERFKSVLRTVSLIKPHHYNTAFKSISSELQSSLQEIAKHTKDIREEDSDLDSFSINEILPDIKKKFPFKLINQLPSYFQSQINLVGKELNFLQLAIDGSYDETELCVNILNYLFNFKIESASMETFRNNHKILSERLAKEEDIKKNRPAIQKWAKELIDLRKMNEFLENKKIVPANAFKTLSSQIDFDELNSLGSFASDIKSQFAISLRSISISSWNDHQDIISAISFIEKALSISDVPDDVQANLENDRKSLYKIKTDNEHLLTCHFCKTNIPNEKSVIKTTLYKVYDRTRYGNQRRVLYHTTEVEIPRCKGCQNIAGKSFGNSAIIIVSSMLAGIGAAALMEGTEYALGGLVGLVVGFIFTEIYKRKFYKNHGLKIVSGKDYIIVKNRKKEGWQFNKPSA